MRTHKYITLMLVMIMSLAIAEAISLPMPISGKVTGQPGAVTIEATNLRTGDVQTTKTTSAGEFLVDASNFKKQSASNDKIKIIIKECKGQSQCEQTVVLNKDFVTANFDITGVKSDELNKVAIAAGILAAAGAVGYGAYRIIKKKKKPAPKKKGGK